ncbi:DNA repair exonuclease [Halalkalirubrum salinum]|uniref:DNA repair exonuclease n=1 Tax=Halalkalirubrum salinum TaxID=2563889 RepID=UPI0010FB13CD|nr:DNA repair exonuclease [Halalkalirubrum salinum]
MPRTSILHISDSHLGKRQYGSDIRREDFAKAFEQAIEVAIDRDVDAVIHTGDLFDDPVPSLPTVMRAADALKPLEEHGIPFYGIVGNHERKNDEQWLDLLRRTSAASRLGKKPTMVGDVALYGIDAVRPSVWDSIELELEEPPEQAAWTILCMHELLTPLVSGMGRVYPAAEVIDRAGIDLDGIALGDLHQPASSVVDGTDVWYASATERGGKDQEETGVVQILYIDNSGIKRHQIELETRPFAVFEIAFGEEDGASHARDVLERHDLDGAVAKVELSGDRAAVTANEVTQMAREAGAAVVSVDDNRGRVDLDVESIEAMSLQGLDDAIEEKLADEKFSAVALDVDREIRQADELDTNVNRVADSFGELLSDAQQQAFDDLGPEETPEAATEMEVEK